MQHALHTSLALQVWIRKPRTAGQAGASHRAAGGQLHVVQHALAVPVEHVLGREGALRDPRRVDVAPPAAHRRWFETPDACSTQKLLFPLA